MENTNIPPDSCPKQPKKLKHAGGAPIQIGTEIENLILELISTTAYSVAKICRKVHISQQSWYLHLLKSTELFEKYHKAKALQHDLYADATRATGEELTTFVKNNDADPRLKQAMISLFKINSDHDRWIAERQLPKSWGPHSTNDVNLAGQGPEAPTIKISFIKSGDSGPTLNTNT